MCYIYTNYSWLSSTFLYFFIFVGLRLILINEFNYTSSGCFAATFRLKPKNIYVNEYKKHEIKRHRRNADAFSQSIYSFLVVSKFIYHLNYLIRLEGFSYKLRSAKLDGIYHFILLTCGRNHDHLCFRIYFTDAL